MHVVYVNHGIGNRFGDVIELNERLREYPELHRAILNHELKHKVDAGFTKKDLIIDLTETGVNKVQLLKFMIHNPKSFSQFLPFYFTKNRGFVYDINLIIVYLCICLFAGISAYFAVII